MDPKVDRRREIPEREGRRRNRPDRGRRSPRHRSSSCTFSSLEERRKNRASRRERDRERRRRNRRDKRLSSSSSSEESSRRRRKRKGRRSSRSLPSHSRSMSRSRHRRQDRKRDNRLVDPDRSPQRDFEDVNRPYDRRRSRSDSPRRRSSRQQRYKRRQRRSRRSQSLSSSDSHSSVSSESSRRQRRHRRRDGVSSKRAGVVSVDDDAMAHNNHAPPAHRPRGGDGPGPHPHPHHLGRTEHNNNNKKRKRDSAESSSLARDDTVGHFWGGPGTIIADTYRVERELGMGTFGRVVECLDLGKDNNRSNRNDRYNNSNNKVVAIKMVRKVKRYYESAVIEADIVFDVNRRGGPRGRGTSHFAVMYDAFNFRGHYCLVFESLGPSLYDYLKRNKYKPFPMRYVRDFSRQLLEAIEFLHSFRLIHTDLKLENILVTKCREVAYGHQLLPESTKIKVIDFGGATYDDEKKSSVVNTRQYRAPEVILSCGWSCPSDLWSLGCILCELYTGELLFATHDNLEHLALIERIIGPFPHRMLQRANQFNSPFPSQAFDTNGRHRLDRVLSKESASHVCNMVPLESIVYNKKDAWFLNLLRSILVIDPECRASARDALRNCSEGNL